MIGDTSSPEFAVHILKLISQRHTPCIVKFKGDPKQYMTMILDINEKTNELKLDELTPNDGHDKILEGNSVRITTSDGGVAVIFKAKVISSGEEDEIAYYISKIPKQVEYIQRREAFRIKLSPVNKIPATFRLDKDIVKKNYLFDISFNGVCFIAEGLDLQDRLAPGDLIGSFQLDMNNEGIPPDPDNPHRYDPELILDCKLLIKRVIYDEHTGHTKISGQFQDLDRLQQRALGRYVCILERHSIQKVAENKI